MHKSKCLFILPLFALACAVEAPPGDSDAEGGPAASFSPASVRNRRYFWWRNESHQLVCVDEKTWQEAPPLRCPPLP